ncbi:MAG: deoxyribose-phosphate aldolase [Holophagaceae bacterium]|nr:deoxyribose-phosphate aldolase [Holophagaceae bacterium]
MDTELAGMIDHTLLKPEAMADEVERLCKEARQYGFFSVCVTSSWVSRCRDLLRGSRVKVCCVVGFPLGAMDFRSKAYETREAIANGADEIDMVINIGALKSGDLLLVEKDVRAVVQAARDKVTKVILETGLLTDEEKVTACQICKKAGATFVKTSTGFVKSSIATEADIALMRKTVGPRMGVKASGGVRSMADAKKMIAAGATRIGTSSGIAIVTGGEGKGY